MNRPHTNTGRALPEAGRALVFVALALGLTACAADKQVPACETLEFDPATCNPLFVPSFDRIYTEVLVGDGTQGCATQSGACHSSADAAGASGGLVFEGSEDQVYDALVPFLDPDPSCGPFAVRINSHDADFVMPPGETRLSEGARCSIAQWMDAGAPR